jgi:hypothetical protein
MVKKEETQEKGEEEISDEMLSKLKIVYNIIEDKPMINISGIVEIVGWDKKLTMEVVRYLLGVHLIGMAFGEPVESPFWDYIIEKAGFYSSVIPPIFKYSGWK